MIGNAGKLLSIGLLLFGLVPPLDGGMLPAGPAVPRLEHEQPRATRMTTRTRGDELGRTVAVVSRVVGIDAALLYAVVMQESSGNPHAVSETGAVGLTQLMPVAVRQYGPEASRLLGRRVDVRRSLDNLLMGALYYRDTLRRAGGNIEQAARLYHGGPNLAIHGPRTVAYGRAVAMRYRRISASAHPTV